MAKSKPGPELHAAINAAMNEWGAAQGLPAMKWRRAESFDSDVYLDYGPNE